MVFKFDGDTTNNMGFYEFGSHDLRFIIHSYWDSRLTELV